MQFVQFESWKTQNGISPLIWILTPRSALRIQEPIFTRVSFVKEALVSQNGSCMQGKCQRFQRSSAFWQFVLEISFFFSICRPKISFLTLFCTKIVKNGNFWVIVMGLLPSSAKPQQQLQLPAAAKLAELQPYFAFHPPPRASRF